MCGRITHAQVSFSPRMRDFFLAPVFILELIWSELTSTSGTSLSTRLHLSIRHLFLSLSLSVSFSLWLISTHSVIHTPLAIGWVLFGLLNVILLPMEGNELVGRSCIGVRMLREDTLPLSTSPPPQNKWKDRFLGNTEWQGSEHSVFQCGFQEPSLTAQSCLCFFWYSLGIRHLVGTVMFSLYVRPVSCHGLCGLHSQVGIQVIFDYVGAIKLAWEIMCDSKGSELTLTFGGL